MPALLCCACSRVLCILLLSSLPPSIPRLQVAALEVPPSVTSDPSYVDSECFFTPGDVVKLPPLGFSALGWMVVRGGSGEEAARAMGRLMGQVHMELKPVGV